MTASILTQVVVVVYVLLGATQAFMIHHHTPGHRFETVLNAATTTTTKDATPNKETAELEQEGYEVYSRHLTPRRERKEVIRELDGKLNWKQRILGYPGRILTSGPRHVKPGTLILLRCGESTYYANDTFTGWLDPDLTEKGIKDCEKVADILRSEGFDPSVVYTSRLKRAIKSAWTILENMEALFIPVYKTMRLNQRMYGSLEGLSKQETATKVGWNAVDAWRNSLKAKPPPLEVNDPNHPRNDRRYNDIPRELLPSTESLLDCQERARSLWDHKIKRDIEQGKTVMVVSHRDALRGLIKTIDGIKDGDIKNIQVPKCTPFVYRFEWKNKQVVPVAARDESATAKISATILKKADDAEERLLFGNPNHQINYRTRSGSLLETVTNLRSGAYRNGTASTPPRHKVYERWSDDPSEFEEYDEFTDADGENVEMNIVSMPGMSSSGTMPVNKDEPLVVLVRHGRTPHNNLGLFTGWEDPPLAPEGIEDAKKAGRLLKRHGFEFDVAYTSWLTRAIQTSYYILDELDSTWLPIVKSWRLNERMYGDLSGKSKKQVANEFGEDKLKKWRRGYKIRPPPTSSYSPNYPGNDFRRAKHFEDLGISWRETLNRSLEARKLVVHRKFPKTESLKDCMDRSLPFYTKHIVEEAVNKGKMVLIASHENAIRGILMHLCDIPEEAMNQLHLPNGLPLVYNVKRRCITLLDDGSDPVDVHDFGPAAKYLLKPCELPDDFYDNV